MGERFISGREKSLRYLTEAVVTFETGTLNWFVVGIGTNLKESKDGSKELREYSGQF